MKQKLGLILAMCHEPQLLILDEPSTGLDPLVQEKLRDHLHRIAREGRTVFFSSHTLSEVEELCHHVAIIRDGRIVADQPLDDLRRQAGYHIRIRWQNEQDAASMTPPAFFEMHRQDGDSWSALTRRPVAELIQWLVGKSIADLTIDRPDLDTVFRRYYQSAEDTTSTGDPS